MSGGESSVFLSIVTTWTVEPPPDPDDPDGPDEPGPESEDGSISLERLDDGGALCWGEAAVVAVTAPDDDIAVETTYGRPVRTGPVSVPRTEKVSFARSADGKLGSVPSGRVTWRWIGVAPRVSVRIDGDRVVLGAKATGVLEVSYQSSAMTWLLRGTGRAQADQCVVDEDGRRSLEAMFVAYRGDQTASLNVEFSDSACDDPDDPDGDPDGEGDGEDEAPGPVIVRVVELCGDGDPISGATVVINGRSYYLPNGEVRLENVAPNTTLNYVASSPAHTTGKGSQTV